MKTQHSLNCCMCRWNKQPKYDCSGIMLHVSAQGIMSKSDLLKIQLEYDSSYIYSLFRFFFWIFKPSNESSAFFGFINFWRVKYKFVIQWREYYPLNFVINVIMTSTCYNANEHEPTIHPVIQPRIRVNTFFCKWFHGMFSSN